MESKRIYEDSYNELVRIRKSLGYDLITINVKELDGVSKEALLKAISDTIATRTKDIQGVILGVQ